METPHIRIESTGAIIRLRQDVTTIGRGQSVDVHLDHPSVSKLHAEIVRRGAYAYVSDLGLSRHGTRVNGKVVAQRLLENGDVLSFGAQRCRVGGLASEGELPETEPRRSAVPELTRREVDVVAALCKPALCDEAFVAPATARDIAADLVVTEAAVKQHLLRLYQKLKIAEGPNRRVRLANEVVARGLVRPLPVAAAGDSHAQAAVPGLPAVPSDAAQMPPPQAVPSRAVPSRAVPSRAVPSRAVPSRPAATGPAAAQTAAARPAAAQPAPAPAAPSQIAS